jgi:hypothetical protein
LCQRCKQAVYALQSKRQQFLSHSVIGHCTQLRRGDSAMSLLLQHDKSQFSSAHRPNIEWALRRSIGVSASCTGQSLPPVLDLRSREIIKNLNPLQSCRGCRGHGELVKTDLAPGWKDFALHSGSSSGHLNIINPADLAQVWTAFWGGCSELPPPHYGERPAPLWCGHNSWVTTPDGGGYAQLYSGKLFG